MPAFGFVGPSYEAANPLQDAQRLINWYPEIDKTEGAKSVIALLGCPGLVSIASVGAGEVRGAWVLPGNTQAVIVIANTAYLYPSMTVMGTLNTSAGQVCIRDNGTSKIVVIADGTAIYSYNLSNATFAVVPSVAADRCAFIDGWLVFNQPGTQQFFTSPVYWNGTASFDATYFALKDSSTDNLVTLIENNRELWLIGERTTEIWYDQGGTNFPFARLQGATLEVGCAAKHTICKTGQGLIWLGRSGRGENIVVMTQDYQFTQLTTPAVAYQISQYAKVDDAIAYTYTEEGHEFYVLTFPTADATWVYDLTTQLWHQRASFDPSTGLFHRHRSNCYMNLADTRLVGDYQSGTIWKMTRKAYSDGLNPLISVRRAPHVWDQSERNRVRNSWLQIEFTPGVGLQSGQGSNPQAMMRMSNDGGFTWGNEHWATIGATGQYKNRVVFRRLGAARDRVYEVRISDPVPRDVVGATLRGEALRA